MAVLLSRVAGAISEVLAGVSEGVEQAGELIDSAKFPEKVIFDFDAITDVNSLSRTTRVIQQPSVKVLSTGDIVEEEVIVRDGSSVQTNVITTLGSQKQELVGGFQSQRLSFEDQAMGTKFVIRGPGYKPDPTNAVADKA